MEDNISKERKNAIHVILSRKSAKLLRIKWRDADKDAMVYRLKRLKKQVDSWVSTLVDEEKEYVAKHKTLRALNKEITFLLSPEEFHI